MKPALLLMFLFVATVVNAQSMILEWTKLHGSNGFNSGANSIHQTSDLGYLYIATIITGNSGDVSGIHGGQEAWLVKTDGAGNIVWQRPTGGTNLDSGYDLVLTDDGGCIIAGSSGSTDYDVTANNGGFDAWVLKVDGLGNVVWDKNVGGTLADYGHSLCKLSDESVVVVGSSSSDDGDILLNQGYQDILVFKLNPNGNLLWEKTFGGSAIDQAYDITATSDGGFLITGETNSDDGDITNAQGYYDAFVLKIDSLGNKIWMKTFGGSGWDITNCGIESSDGNYVISGGSDSYDGDVTSSHGDNDAWLIKLDTQGNLMWLKNYGGSQYDNGEFVIESSIGRYILVGFTYSDDGDVSVNKGNADAWVVVTGTDGSLQEEMTIGGSAEDIGFSITETIDGRFMLGGSSGSNDGDVTGHHGDRDVMIAKLRIFSDVGLNANDHQVLVSPNPSSGKFNVEVNSDWIGLHYNIVDLNGRIVEEGMINTSSFEIELSDAVAGTYFLNVDNSTSPFKLIKHD